MRRVLISGAGIAGPTLAYWLTRHGFTPTIVERAPALRTGGYVIDFWGAGLDVARRMGILPDVLGHGYQIREVRIVDDEGRRIAAFPSAVFTRALGDGFTSDPRGDLTATIFRALPASVETVFGDTIEHIEQTPEDVRVSLARGGTRAFDLVVGADGLHSQVRALAFGPEPRFERYLGLKVAAFAAAGYRPRDELVYMMSSEVGQQLSRFSMRDDRTMFLFTFADPDPAFPDGIEAQKRVLRERFGRSGWECRSILERLDEASELYFDRVSQIDMGGAGGWTKGRVALVGDAAFCVSLLGGHGSALAMAGAYILAGELGRAGGQYETAFARYRQLFGPFILTKQKAARRFVGSFAPKSRIALFMRNRIFNLLSIGWVARLVGGRGFRDAIALPDY
jgi:2-polyprenyl-6-methoxyphenol hydroxylase-like FAD-dependent oxidoreductase